MQSNLTKDYLLEIKDRMNELYTQWYTASSWNDKRSREKKKREACVAISKYSETLPPEILGLFDSEVAYAALNPQFAGDDIGPCIRVLEKKIKEIEDNEKSTQMNGDHLDSQK